jgi:hypothetical protein
MIAHNYPIEQANGRVATNAQTSGWHLWTVIIPRRSISGKLVSGQVWRRRHGAKWAYKKFVEYADRDITGSGSGSVAPAGCSKWNVKEETRDGSKTTIKREDFTTE